MANYDDFVISALQEEGLATREAVARAAQHAVEQKMSVAEALVSLGLVNARQLALVRATISECPYVDLANFEIDIRNAGRVPRAVAERHIAFPLFDLGQVVTVGMADPLDLRAVDQLRSLLKADVEPVLCDPSALRALMDRAYSMAGSGEPESSRADAPIELTTGEEPIVAAVNHIIAQAIEEGASDIHIGPDEHELHLRFRVDGVLRVKQGPSLSAHSGLVQRLKVMANLDLTQTRRPQDGKIRFPFNGRTMDIRLSTIPTVAGENVVMRILASGLGIKGFAELGFPARERKHLEELIEHPHGMVLVTGPTGSGKTTTLYTALKQLNTPDRNIMTIEDPVEIRLPMVRQVQANAEIGLTFAGALRSILRQDPDVVLLGEIRDEETARIAVQAALTGHLVLSTLHTNDAPGALARLREFGLPAFAINASVLCVIAQRLVRRNCSECITTYDPPASLIARFGADGREARYQRGRGCSRCASAGFRGRIGLYEMLSMSAGVQDATDRGGAINAVRSAALADGYRPMWHDGLEKAILGLTTLEEVAGAAAIEEDSSDSTRDASTRRAAA